MAIQMRRGQLVDFDQTKMRPGEWGVSIDSDSGSQHVYMCFSAGVVKRMATWEDFESDMESLHDAITSAQEATAAALVAVEKANAVVANKVGINDTTTSLTTTWSSSEINDNLTNMLPGGTNILRGTNTNVAASTTGTWSTGAWRPNSPTGTLLEKISITDSPDPNLEYGWRLTRTSAAMADITVYQTNIPFLAGHEYTVFFYARKVSGSGRIQVSMGLTGSYVQDLKSVGTEWAPVSFKFVPTIENGYLVFRLRTSDGENSIEICGESLKVGNKVSGWSPSPWGIRQWTGSTPTTENGNVTVSSTIRVFTNEFMRLVYGSIVLAAGTYAAGAQLIYIGTGLWSGRITCQTTTGDNVRISYNYSTGYINIADAITLSTNIRLMIDAAIPI